MPTKKRIIVQGGDRFYERISVHLAPSEMDVEQSASVSDTVRKINAQSETYGLMLIDMDEKSGSGLKLLNSLQRSNLDIPVIALAAHGTVDGAVEAMRCGAVDYLVEPVSQEMLQTSVERYMKHNKTGLKSSGGKDRSVKTKDIITDDPSFKKVLDLARRVAPSDATVLIRGESGSGKELLAYYIHKHSRRFGKSYVAVNCAALPENLAESELFGYEKGAFTGAAARKTGKFELADNGTLLLDEISELPLPLQAKLLRCIQEREVDRVGGTKPIPVDVRIIAVSNVDLKQKVLEGQFREDLFFRLNVIPVAIPPLRNRRGDISLLAEHFLAFHSRRNNREIMRPSAEAIDILKRRYWKGNVRELENVIERAVMLADGVQLLPEHLILDEEDDESESDFTVRAGVSVREMEEKLIFATLKEVGNNRTMAAKMLGVSIRTLRNKLNEYKHREVQVNI